MSFTPVTDFLGQGWSFPLEGTAGRIGMRGGAGGIGQAILLILQTGVGERVMMPEFGCRLPELLFSVNNATTASLAEVYVQQALERWEPRIALQRLTAAYDPVQPNCLCIEIDYLILARNQPDNLVYPFYLDRSNA